MQNVQNNYISHDASNVAMRAAASVHGVHVSDYSVRMCMRRHDYAGKHSNFTFAHVHVWNDIRT